MLHKYLIETLNIHLPNRRGEGDADLHRPIGAGSLGVDDDPGLVVDQIVCIVSKEWIHARPRDPRCLRVRQ